MSPAVWFAFVWTIGKRWVFWTLVPWTRSYPTFRDYGNTRPAYMNDLHTCCWCFDNQFPIITCWNSYFRWLHYRGHLFIGLVLNYCKSLSPGIRKREFVCVTNMLSATQIRLWKVWQNDKQFIFLRYRTLFKGSRLEIYAYQAACKLSYEAPPLVVGLTSQWWILGLPPIGP